MKTQTTTSVSVKAATRAFGPQIPGRSIKCITTATSQGAPLSAGSFHLPSNTFPKQVRCHNACRGRTKAARWRSRVRAPRKQGLFRQSALAAPTGEGPAFCLVGFSSTESPCPVWPRCTCPKRGRLCPLQLALDDDIAASGRDYCHSGTHCGVARWPLRKPEQSGTVGQFRTTCRSTRSAEWHS